MHILFVLNMKLARHCLVFLLFAVFLSFSLYPDDYGMVFRADYSQTLNDTQGGLVPSGTYRGYSPAFGGYAVNLSNASIDGLNYGYSAPLYSVFYNNSRGFTIAARFKMRSMPSGVFSAIYGVFNTTSNERSFLLTKYSTNDSLYFISNNNGTSSGSANDLLISNASFAANAWYDVIAVYNGSQFIYYVNGTRLPGSVKKLYKPSSAPFTVGTFQAPSYMGSFDGEIDFVYVWNGSMSASDVQTFRESIYPQNLSYERLFQVDFSSNATDSIGHVSPSGHYSSLDAGQVGMSALFLPANNDGLNYTVSFQDKLYDSDGFSVFALVNPASLASTGAFGGIVGIYHSPSDRSWILDTYGESSGGTDLGLSYSNMGSGLNGTSVFSSVSTDKWYPLFLTYNGSVAKGYLGSSEVFSNETGQFYHPSSSLPLQIGSFFNGMFAGYIDEVIIYDKALSASNISSELAGMGVSYDNSAPVGNLSQNTDLAFNNSDGLVLSYDLYYWTNSTGGIAIIPDSWESSKSSYTSYAKAMAQDYGMIGVAVNTRGKGNSQGLPDALGYECKDIYEIAEMIKSNYSAYYNSSQGVHIFGFSAGGGKALLCTGRYPDYFTSAFGTASVANMTDWYALDASSLYRASIRERVGNSVSSGTHYQPGGWASVNGSVENQQAYTARDASYLGAYNTLASVMLSHNSGDDRVPIALSYEYNATWKQSSKTQDYLFQECNVSGHSMCNMTGGMQWLNGHKGTVSLPSSGDFRIGGWVSTSRFGVEFLDDVGYTGTVAYDFSSTGFTLDIASDTYHNSTAVFVDNVPSSLSLYDNSVLFAQIASGSIVESNSSYNVSVSGSRLSFVIPHMSEHVITGVGSPSNDSGYSNVGTIGINITSTNQIAVYTSSSSGNSAFSFVPVTPPAAGSITLMSNESSNVTDGDTGFLVENQGNINVSITVASDKDASSFIGGASPLFQMFGAVNESDACPYLNATMQGLSASEITLCPSLAYADSRDTIWAYVLVKIDSDSPPSANTATLVFTSTLAS